MNFKPRDYQQECFDNVRFLMSKNAIDLPELKVKGLSFDKETISDRQIKSVMVASAPGSGKGDMLCWLAYAAWVKGGTVLIWVHRNELCRDLAERLHKKFGVPKQSIGYIMSGVKENRKLRIQIASVMTKIRRDTDWLAPTVVLTDECHRILSDSQRTLLRRVPDARLVGFTATPYVTGSSKKEGFEKVFDCMIQLTTYSELVAKKFLLPSVVYAPAGTASMDGVKIRMGDYDQSDLEKAFMEERLYAALFKEWKRVTGGKQQTMIFNVTQKHNKAVNDFFRKHGVNAVAIDDKTPASEREKLIKKFKEGPFVEDPIHVICSVMLFTEGIDSPYCKVAVLNYSTKSPIKYFQSSMRAGRPVWNSDHSDWLRLENGKYYKDKVVVIDLGGNTLTHGMIDFYDALGFEMNGRRRKGEAPTKICPNDDCRRVIFASYQKCPHCGHEFPKEVKKDKKKYLDEVGLQELNGDKALQKMILGMSQEQIWTCHAGYLRVIALTKGYQPSWCYHVLRDRGEYLDGDEKAPNDWAVFYEYLASAEKMKGMASVYDRMKGRQISK